MENRNFEKIVNPVYYYQSQALKSFLVFKHKIFFFELSKLLNSNTILKEIFSNILLSTTVNFYSAGFTESNKLNF